jgi:hypothetical protein
MRKGRRDGLPLEIVSSGLKDQPKFAASHFSNQWMS